MLDERARGAAPSLDLQSGGADTHRHAWVSANRVFNHACGCCSWWDRVFCAGGVIGEEDRRYAPDVETVHAAAIAELESLGLDIGHQRSDQVSGLIEATFADGTSVTLHTQRDASGQSILTVQVGLFGDEQRSAHSSGSGGSPRWRLPQ